MNFFYHKKSNLATECFRLSIFVVITTMLLSLVLFVNMYKQYEDKKRADYRAEIYHYNWKLSIMMLVILFRLTSKLRQSTANIL